MSPPRIAFAGGGSAGHLFPSLAVAQRLLDLAPGAGLLFLGARRALDAQLLHELGHAHRLLRARPFPYSVSPALVSSLGALGLATVQALGALARFRPEALFASGGYVSAPAVVAARLLRVPCVLHAGDALPDRTGRALGRLASRISCAFEAAVAYFPQGRAVFTGPPIRKELFGHSREAGLARFGLSAERRTLLVTGGSQGARALNEAILAALPALRARGDIQVIHLTGALEFDSVAARSAQMGASAPFYQCHAFWPEMGPAYAAADLVLSRGGSSSLGEGMALGKPMIVVPYPGAAAHQAANARPLEAAGAIRIIENEDLTGEALTRAVADLLESPERLAAMSAAALRVGRPQAAEQIARMTLQVARRLPPGDTEPLPESGPLA